MMTQNESVEGILLVNKPRGVLSFQLVAKLRKLFHVKKVGHAGTLDPFATGVMVMLVGRSYTRLSDSFLSQDKEYQAKVCLGISTDTYDCEGKALFNSSFIPSLEEIQVTIAKFQGEIEQIPPMYSAKKIKGKKLYELARQGKEVERLPVKIHLEIQLLSYDYPFLDLIVKCSKGTYIRSLAYDLGQKLGCGAHLFALCRTRSGLFHLKECIDGSTLELNEDLKSKLIKWYGDHQES